jgi:hypothetical protein
MAYIGNTVTSVRFLSDIFSGTGSQTTFVLTRAPFSNESIAVFISGSYQKPGIDYTTDGLNLNFTSAPASGTNNISVLHLGNGYMATQVPSDRSVTTIKIAEGAITGNLMTINSIRGNNIVAGTITGNLVALNSISSNNFSSEANTKIFSSGIISSIIFGG